MNDGHHGAWLDLFAGAGGWDVGARALGIDPLGVELDADACATRIAARLPTIQEDIAALDPMTFGAIEGLIASPPCQTFSVAGDQVGRRDGSAVLAALEALGEGRDIRAGLLAGEVHPEPGALFGWPLEDPRSLLVVEPLRWALALRPRFVALEQVPTVLPIWEATAAVLRAAGWHVWTGKVRSDEFGVPQTRERAILIADRECPVAAPVPSHQRWSKGVEPVRPADALGRLPWVSMAEALGWGLVGRPSVTLSSTSGAGGPRPLDGGSGARQILRDAQAEGPAEWRSPVVLSTGQDFRTAGDRETGQTRDPSEPAPTLGAKAGGQWNWWGEGGAPTLRSSNQAKATERTAAEPAPTIATAKMSLPEWTTERPATTVAGDNRVHPPGHKTNAEDPPGKYDGRAGVNAVRVTIDEAAVLQGFPVGFPWQGTQTSQFRQVGNAIPPPMAAAILAALTSTKEGR